jgi:hypothetical protein
LYSASFFDVEGAGTGCEGFKEGGPRGIANKITATVNKKPNRAYRRKWNHSFSDLMNIEAVSLRMKMEREKYTPYLIVDSTVSMVFMVR